MNTVLIVKGMTCAHCEKAVQTAVGNLVGVTAVDVDLTSGQVNINYDEMKVTVAEITEAIEDQGYDVVQ